MDYNQKPDGLPKKKILNYIFSKKLVFENGRVATFEFTTPVQVLLNVYRVFEGSETKKRSKMTSCPVWLPR